MTYIIGNRIKRFTRAATLAVGLAVGLVSGLTAPSEAAGLLSPKDGNSPALSIRDHMVNVVIEDGYAITRIEQVFTNPHTADFEAVYSFPVPDKAAVSEFTYWIDGKPVSGEVLPKKKAREVYEKEKAAGRETAITEQDDYKTFDITVWPVKAGKDVRVRLSYIHPAHIDTSMGRYVYPLEEGGVDFQKMSFWSTNDEVKGRFSFDLELRSSYPVKSLRLPAHPSAKISRDAEGDWRVHIGDTASSGAASGKTSDQDETPSGETSQSQTTPNPGESQAAATRLDTDIVMYWKLEDGLPASIDVITHKEASAKRGTFMMVLTPGDDMKTITKGRDWVFVLDISGSMKSKFSTLAEGVSQGLRKLGPKDRYRIVLFNNQSRGDRTFINATPDNINDTIRALSNVSPDGGTNLYAGLAHGLASLDSDRSTGLVLVTDGVANVGETHKREFIKLVRKQDVRLFTLVMGNSANRPLLKAISLASGGTAVGVSNSDDVVGAVLSATSKLNHAALHDVKIDIDGVKVSDLTPSRVGSLYRGQQLVVFGHYRGSGDAKLSLKAKLSGKDVTYKTRVTLTDTNTRNPEIERLWAFASIEDVMQEMDLFGENDDLKQAATDLAVEHSLVTPYTSMVVVREKIFADYGIKRLNNDRLVKEAAAQKNRASQTVATRQIANSSTTFKNNRASYSGPTSGSSSGSSLGGGGAIDPFIAVLLLLAVLPVAGGIICRLRQKS
jgi:Ca-activated chloride channel family protein